MSFDFSSEHILADTECSQELGFFFYVYKLLLVLVILWIFCLCSSDLEHEIPNCSEQSNLFSDFIHTLLPLFYALFLHLCVLPSIHPPISNIPVKAEMGLQNAP